MKYYQPGPVIKLGWTRVPNISNKSVNRAIEWCEKNGSEKHFYKHFGEANSFWFEDEKDAFIFQLTWVGR